MLFESGEGIDYQASGWRQLGSLRVVLLPDKHVGELGTVTYQVAELADFRGRDEAGSYQVAHEDVTDSFGILVVGLVPFLGLGIHGMRKGNKTEFLKDVEDRDSVSAGGLHADLETGVFGEPVREGKICAFLQAYCYRYLVDAKIYECNIMGTRYKGSGDLNNEDCVYNNSLFASYGWNRNIHS